ncbi:MAG: nicotinamide-nucleotide amidohydrolase family protein [Bacteroidota bacterium]
MKRAWILSIGNELLIGDTINTNASWLGQFLTQQGFRVTEVRTISDDPDQIRETIREGREKADLVVSTGGLGPTHDDITKKVVADLFGYSMKTDPEILAILKERFKRRGLSFTPSNAEQALVPDGARVLRNEKGTAPGLWFANGGGAVVLLPGVPREMKHLMETGVQERIEETFDELEVRYTHYLKTAGEAESHLSDEIIGDLTDLLKNGSSDESPLSHKNGPSDENSLSDENLPSDQKTALTGDAPTLAYLPSPAGVVLRIEHRAETLEEAKAGMQPLLDRIRQRAGGRIYTEDRHTPLAQVVGDLLRRRGWHVAVAESCTGGHIGDQITDIPGSSDWFEGGIVSYSNEVKQEMLGVQEKDLLEHGAVSLPVALQMARGVADRLGTRVGISATGIAGPDGGSEEKPVGTVWIGFFIDGESFALRSHFTGDRRQNKIRTATVALETLRRVLSGVDVLPYGLQKQFLGG